MTLRRALAGITSAPAGPPPGGVPSVLSTTNANDAGTLVATTPSFTPTAGSSFICWVTQVGNNYVVSVNDSDGGTYVKDFEFVDGVHSQYYFHRSNGASGASMTISASTPGPSLPFLDMGVMEVDVIPTFQESGNFKNPPPTGIENQYGADVAGVTTPVARLCVTAQLGVINQIDYLELSAPWVRVVLNPGYAPDTRRQVLYYQEAVSAFSAERAPIQNSNWGSGRYSLGTIAMYSG